VTTDRNTTDSRWPHRLAVVLALTTFPLIWVGGLVTTYDAGMAVPDWPGTYGYNLFAYPWSTWLFGPWDLLIEHGHRLLGALVGLLTLVLAAVVWWKDDRLWFKQLALAAIALVIVQGVLGGARVVWDERLVALLHGCTGPAFFAFVTALVVCSSKRWRQIEARDVGPAANWVAAAWWLAGVAYVQLVAGAVLRHIPLWAPPDLFRIALLFHLGLAAVLTVQAIGLAWKTARNWSSLGWLRAPAVVLISLVLIQIVLGGGTYVAKYAWPMWADTFVFAATHVTTEKSLHQSLITTAHVANGSLILATAVVLAVRATRLQYVAAGACGAITFSSVLRAA
jgi:heme a synthase